jgi:hypothetical protein
MAIPAVRLSDGTVVVALIAELSFIRMAFHTGIDQTHIVLLAVERSKYPLAVPDNPGSPIIEELHVILFHIFGRHNALLFRCHDFGVRLVIGFAAGHVVPNRAGYQGEENYYATDDFPCIIHF